MDLNSISSPAQIKSMTLDRLKELAGEMRKALLKKLSNHGGHVGPNLGFVEATIAMHYVFDSPRDKIVFDVSHQCYAHKMLTGRMKAFTDPIQYDSVSGYTNPNESEHDFFTVGHTSTAVSLACGLAKARDMRHEKSNIIAVVGDGSLSGGEAFEGLDNAATLGSNFIAVVNDNDMSIAENHGGLYESLRRLRETNGRDECNYFKSLNLDYRFVADGNDLEELINVFTEVRDIDHPVVVHVVTDKGHGYAPAEHNKETFHYRMPFDLTTGDLVNKGNGESYNSITRDLLMGRFKTDPLTVAITSATPTVMGFTPEYREAAGKHFVDVGIAEEHAAALSSGLAKGGCKPFWGVYSSFVQRVYDQVSQDIAINSSAATIAVFMGTVDGMNDVTHLGFFDIALLANIPNVVFLAPTCRQEYINMVNWSLDQNEHPVVIRVPDPIVYDLDIETDNDYSELNKYRVVRPGKHIAVIAAGNMLRPVLEAADALAEKGITPTIINPRFLSGLDVPLLDSLKANHNAVITLEDGIIEGGFGQKIATYYAESSMRVRCLGLKKEFLDRYDHNDVKAKAGMTPAGIVANICDLLD